jgi:hypothetical protein
MRTNDAGRGGEHMPREGTIGFRDLVG